MCTLSWIRDNESYQVFFNRDEQRSRSQAQPPQCVDHSGVPVLLPLDPDGGGSWISVNGHGLSLCLLNYYQGTIPHSGKKLISRGKLLRSLAHTGNIESLNELILTTDLTHYAPFTLVAFQIKPDQRLPQEKIFQWDGAEIHRSQPENMITSSSVKFDEVSKQRQQFYAQNVSSSPCSEHEIKHKIKNSTDKHISFHASHGTEKNHRSVCMHREDARTVSFSHILVTKSHVEFRYHDGSPCESSGANTTISQHRIS